MSEPTRDSTPIYYFGPVATARPDLRVHSGGKARRHRSREYRPAVLFGYALPCGHTIRLAYFLTNPADYVPCGACDAYFALSEVTVHRPRSGARLAGDSDAGRSMDEAIIRTRIARELHLAQGNRSISDIAALTNTTTRTVQRVVRDLGSMIIRPPEA